MLGVSGVPGCEESAHRNNKAKPMFVFDADVSKVFDTSLLKGGVTKAMGHGLMLAFAVMAVHGSPWAAVGVRLQRAAGEAHPPVRWQVAPPMFFVCKTRNAQRVVCRSLSSSTR